MSVHAFDRSECTLDGCGKSWLGTWVITRRPVAVSRLLTAMLLSACGGGDGDGTDTSNTSSTTVGPTSSVGTSSTTDEPTTAGSETAEPTQSSSDTGQTSDSTAEPTTQGPTTDSSDVDADSDSDSESDSDSDSSGEPDLLFDDFEGFAAGGDPNPGLWTKALVGSNGTILVDDTYAHSGSNSVHIHQEGFSTLMAANGIFPVPDNRFYGRVYMRVAGGLTQGHVTWIEAGVVQNDVDEARIGSNIGMLDVNHWPGDEEQRADVPLMPDTWHCLEFLYDGSAHELHVWFEGEAVPGLTVTDWTTPPGGEGNNPNNPIPEWAPQFESIRFGWELGGSGDIWFDDIALATSRVGC